MSKIKISLQRVINFYYFYYVTYRGNILGKIVRVSVVLLFVGVGYSGLLVDDNLGERAARRDRP